MPSKSDTDDAPLYPKTGDGSDLNDDVSPQDRTLSKRELTEFQQGVTKFTLMTARGILKFIGFAALIIWFVDMLARLILSKDISTITEKMFELITYVATVTLTYLFAKSDKL